MVYMILCSKGKSGLYRFLFHFVVYVLQMSGNQEHFKKLVHAIVVAIVD